MSTATSPTSSGKGGTKEAGEAGSLVRGRPAASQWNSPTVAPRSGVAKQGRLLSQVGASENDLVGGSHHV